MYAFWAIACFTVSHCLSKPTVFKASKNVSARLQGIRVKVSGNEMHVVIAVFETVRTYLQICIGRKGTSCIWAWNDSRASGLLCAGPVSFFHVKSSACHGVIAVGSTRSDDFLDNIDGGSNKGWVGSSINCIQIDILRMRAGSRESQASKGGGEDQCRTHCNE